MKHLCDPLETRQNVQVKGVVYIGKCRIGTTGHVWYRGDAGIQGV